MMMTIPRNNTRRSMNQSKDIYLVALKMHLRMLHLR